MVNVASIKLERELGIVTIPTRQEEIMKEVAIIVFIFLGLTFGRIAVQNSEAAADQSNTNGIELTTSPKSRGLLTRLQAESSTTHPNAVHHHHKKVFLGKDGVQPWIVFDECPYSEKSRCELVYQVVSMLENAPDGDEFENFKVTIPKGDGKLYHRVGIALNFKRPHK